MFTPKFKEGDSVVEKNRFKHFTVDHVYQDDGHNYYNLSSLSGETKFAVEENDLELLNKPNQEAVIFGDTPSVDLKYSNKAITGITKEIESVAVIKEFPGCNLPEEHYNVFYTNKTPLYFNAMIALEPEKYPEFFKVNYKLKPKLLKRSDGSLISEPKEGEEIIIIKLIASKHISRVKYKYDEHRELLRLGRVFDENSWGLAEKKANMLSKQLEIQNEIDLLNTQEDLNEKKDHLIWLFNVPYEINNWEAHDDYIRNTPENKLMSHKTADKILAKFNQNELKQYLGYII